MARVPPGSFIMGTSDGQIDFLAQRDELAKKWKEKIASLKPGEAVRLIIASGGTDREVTVQLGHRMERSYLMKAIANPTPLQSEILQGLMQQK